MKARIIKIMDWVMFSDTANDIAMYLLFVLILSIPIGLAGFML